jgi:hypothetical protein
MLSCVIDAEYRKVNRFIYFMHIYCCSQDSCRYIFSSFRPLFEVQLTNHVMKLYAPEAYNC